MSLGFGVGDLIQVSNLAFRLWRRCRDSSEEFKNLSYEVASLRLVVEDVRVTILEHDVEGEKVEQILHYGQGCLDCLLDLEELLRKYERLGSRHKRTWDRLRWDKEKVADIRQRVITNTSFLSSFNLSLTRQAITRSLSALQLNNLSNREANRSSTSRIESLLRQFLQQWKQGELEGSIVSMETIKTIEDGNDDVWRELGKELEDAGITEEQINDNKQFITEWIKQAILTGNVENRSLGSASFHTASEGAPSTILSTLTLTGDDIPPSFDFPGDEFRLTKDLVHSVGNLYKDAPEDFMELQDQISGLLQAMLEIQVGTGDPQSLYHHEKLVRKDSMETALPPLNNSLKQLQDLASKIKSRTDEDEIQWNVNVTEVEEVSGITNSLTCQTLDLDGLFRDLGTLVLASIEDRLKKILQETREGHRQHSILHSWDELELELADGQDIRIDDVRSHRDGILSFIKVSIEEHESSRRDSVTFSNSETLGESINSRINSISSPKPTFQKSEGSISELGRSQSSFTGSLPSEASWTGDGLPAKPKRASVLFVDWNNEVRSPMAEAFFSHLKETHPALAGHFSRALSAGLSAPKPGVPLPSGVGLLLRDNGIHENFIHTSRRLERRDVEKYEYVLVMNKRQMEDILSIWPSRDESDQSETAPANRIIFREDIEGKVHLLGSFGNEGMREVSLPESIGNEYWFQMGTRRIYPGYDKCWNEIKKYVADFIFDLTGYDVNSHAAHSADEEDSREVSEDESEEYNDPFLNMSQNPWGYGEERSPFEELSRSISNFQEGPEGVSPSESQPAFSNMDSPITVIIRAEQQQLESDEEVLHKHHEQFERLVNLLSTDVGDSSFSSLRSMVLEWEQDSNRALLTVSTGNVRWVLQKSPTDAADSCALCASHGTRSGLVLDHNLEVISRAEADVIAEYLAIAVQQANQQPTAEESSRLERIRDNPVPGRPAAPPSIRDDVSVSVRNDRTPLTHSIEQIRRKDAERQLLKLNGNSPAPGSQTPDNLRPGNLVRRQTEESELPPQPVAPRFQHRMASDATITPIMQQGAPSAVKPTKTATETPTPKLPTPKKQTSVLFLSTSHLHGAIMAEIYLFSLVDKENALASRVCDVVSAGISEITAEQKLNPRKLERLFKAHEIPERCWPQKPERLLVPEDVLEFDYILLLNDADSDAPYAFWAEDNPDEAEDMKDSMKEGEDWRANFKTRVLDLSTFCSDENRRGKSFMDPVQPGQGGKFGVKFSKFEEAFRHIKDAVDRFLLRELRFNVEEMRFVKVESRKIKGGVSTPGTPSSTGEFAE